ncbi:GntR family transcriptional regulator [Actinoallomurus purpureus]|uniref:GntR family transcriptional regulator n=1 Tax=Actinoallomurus purpureus TaxID=478114 RepID=UPI002093F36C|nr:GntR family transcriptional regulator [Actinoallomurus purpureus]MCO6004493.1 GntR family transcriptional regulator [Actinoallomurus purpureus]
MADAEFPLPKYARVVTELRRRIENGTYRPGDMLPSEAQLVREFGVGRTTVVRALQILQHDGWISREHGLGSYAKGRPTQQMGTTRPGQTLLDRPETNAGVTVVEARPATLPRHVAALLGLEENAAGVLRQWVGEHGGQPVELISLWLPEPIAAGTDLGARAPLATGVRQHLRKLKQIRVDHIVERMSARLPSGQEADLLKVEKTAPVLGVTATAYDAGDRPLLVADVALPGELHELEDVYSVTD